MIRAILAAVMVLCAPASWAQEWYVTTGGNDSNAGTRAAPFKTIQRALNAAQAGHTIYVGKGEYRENLTTPRSGTSALPILVIGDNRGTNTGQGKGTITVRSMTTSPALTVSQSWVEFRTMTFRGGADVIASSGSSVTLRTCNVRYPTDDAVQVTGGSLTVIGGTYRDAPDAGFEVSANATLTVQSATIRNNVLGVRTDHPQASATITRCAFNAGAGWHVRVERGSALATNNLMTAGAGLIWVEGHPQASGRAWFNTVAASGSVGGRVASGTLEFVNNIVVNASQGVVRSGGTLTHSNNLYWNVATQYTGAAAGAGDQTADPMFTSATNYTLQSTSPAINAGLTAGASGVTSSDRAGALRPQGGGWDAGAYERGVAPQNLPYFTNFESGVGAGWSVTTNDTNATVSRFSGRFGATTQVLMVNTTADTDYVAIFDLYLFDSWDGSHASHGQDFFSVEAGGETVLRETMSWQFGFPFSFPDWPEVWSTNFAYSSGYRDAAFRRVVAEFTATDAVTAIVFRGQPTSGVDDESWGIDNVRVVRADQAAAYMPAYAELGHRRGANVATASARAEMGGVVWGDWNDDGYPDLFLAGSNQARQLSSQSGLNFATTNMGNITRQPALADFDNDGRVDVWTPGFADGNTERLLRSVLGVLTNAGHAGFFDPSTNAGAAAADVNLDGWIDVAAFSGNGNFIGINQGATAGSAPTFVSDVAAASGLNGAGDFGAGGSVASIDLNNDGVLDFFYTYNGGRLFVSGAAGYSRVSRGIAITTTNADRAGAAWGDFNNDGEPDLVTCDPTAGRPVQLWRNPGGAANFSNVAASAGLSAATGMSSACWGDFDNDGDLDLFLVSNVGACQMYANSGAPGYTFTLSEQGSNITAQGLDACFADADLDGNLDLALSCYGQPSRLFMNRLAIDQYLLVRLVGKGAGGTNAAGVGVRVDLLNAAGTLLGRRDLGVARGLGTEPVVAHFGGIDPNQDYTARVWIKDKSYTVPVRPAAVQTTFGATIVPQMLTINEASLVPSGVRVTRWREVGPEGQ